MHLENLAIKVVWFTLVWVEAEVVDEVPVLRAQIVAVLAHGVVLFDVVDHEAIEAKNTARVDRVVQVLWDFVYLMDFV